MSGLEKLKGRFVKSIEINKEKDLLRLICEDGVLFASAVGDCCSKSWYEHVNGLDALIGGTIAHVEEKDLGEVPSADEYESIQKYSYTIKTDKGLCDIEMRNSSNGYYGGEMEIDFEAKDPNNSERKSDATKPLTQDF